MQMKIKIRNLILTLSYLRGNKFIGTDRFLYSNVGTFVVCFFSRVMNTVATTSSKIQSESELWKSLSVWIETKAAVCPANLLTE